MNKAFFKTLAKVLISLSIIAVLVFNFNLQPEQLLGTLKALSIWDLGIALAGYFAFQSISVFKWLKLAQSMNIGGTMGQYYQFYLLGMFFNLFMPTSVGGDVGRAWLLSKNQSTRWTKAFLTTLSERFTGLSSLMIYVTVCMLLLGTEYRYYSLFLGLTVLITLMTLLFTYGFQWIEHHRWGKWLVKKLVRHPDTPDEELESIWPTPHSLTLGLIYSTLFHTGIIFLQIWLLKQLGGDASFVLITVSYGLSGILSLLPSINGAGFREYTITWFLVHWGQVPNEIAATFSLVWLSIILLTTVPGALLALKQQLSFTTRKKI